MDSHNNKIQKKSPLNGAIERESENHPLYEKMKDVETPAEETITIQNELTGASKDIILHRDGISDEKMSQALISKDLTRDQKDSMLANYLFERGHESSSFLMELFRSKGAHVQQTQVFKTQMRFDFETFVSMFTLHLDMLAETTFNAFHLPDDFYSNVVKRLEEARTKNTKMDIETAVRVESGRANSNSDVLLLVLAVRNKDAAESLRNKVKEITLARERENGYGIYIDKNSKVYDIFDKDIEEKVKEDKEDLNKKMSWDSEEEFETYEEETDEETEESDDLEDEEY